MKIINFLRVQFMENVQANYDTELTLRDQTGTLIDFNDDYIGCGKIHLT